MSKLKPTIQPSSKICFLNLLGIAGNNFETLDIIINAINGLCQQAELAVSEISFNLYDQIPIVVDVGDPAVVECFGDEVILQPNGVSGGYIGDSNNYTYQWYDENGSQIGSEASLLVNTSADAEYQLIVYDDCQDQEIISSYFVVLSNPPSTNVLTNPFFSA